MNTPNNAVEAALEEFIYLMDYEVKQESDKEDARAELRRLLELARPSIAAQALREQMPCMANKQDSVWLKRCAEDLDPS